MRKSKHQQLLTDSAITSFKKPAKGRKRIMDTKVPNFGVSVTEKGTKSYFLVARFPGSDSGPTRREIDKVGAITLADARDRAQKWNNLIADGKDPARVEAKASKVQVDKDKTTVDAVLNLFVKRHASKLRSADQVDHAFTYVRPRLGYMSIYDVRRSDIVDMLDHVEDKAGPAMADRVLAQLRKAFGWQMARDDEFLSPIVRGMARTKPKQRARERTLEDDEIRDLWAALDSASDLPACYPRFVKMLLLTATRRNESAFMHATEIEGDVWTIPGDRYKTGIDHVVPLTVQARALIGDKPSGYVFSTKDGKKGFSGFSKAKRALEAEIGKIRKAARRPPMKQWQLHDLRRTARSLMSRAKVPTDHAERALGHVMGGVRETYDRYEYLDETRDAFESLAVMVDMILNPPASNVVRLAER
jgi:integrase